MRARLQYVLGLIALALCSGASQAADREYGDWAVGVNDDASLMYAATTNDSGDVLAEFCYFEDRECVWVLGTETQCEEGDEYPVLANSSGGARHLVVTCLMDGDDGDHFYGFDWKELEQVVKGERWMGLAFPMRGDAFKVVRFSLDGIDQATEVLDSGFRRALENDSTRPRNTKNEIM